MEKQKQDSRSNHGVLIPQSTGNRQNCVQPAKWAALVDDKVIPMPQREVKVTVIKEQACVSDGKTLIRDHNSPHDRVVADNEIIDLAQGNVFYSLSGCEVQPRPACSEPAKLALFVDDRARGHGPKHPNRTNVARTLWAPSKRQSPPR